MATSWCRALKETKKDFIKVQLDKPKSRTFSCLQVDEDIGSPNLQEGLGSSGSLIRAMAFACLPTCRGRSSVMTRAGIVRMGCSATD